MSIPLPLLGRGGGACAQSAIASAADIRGFGTDVDATREWAVGVGATAPLPGGGRTRDLYELLAATAAVDVGAARVLEPHLDACAILAQAGNVDLSAVDAGPDASWGVFAAEGPGTRLSAAVAPDGVATLTGTKPWCSLAGCVSHALVTAWVSDDSRGLFAVSLRDERTTAHDGPWVARGLSQIVSAPVDFDDTPAVAVGAPGWYLRRPGFAWGGIGVAAVWWGAALPIVQRLADAARRPGADQLAAAALGDADAAMWAARAALVVAAAEMDGDLSGDSTGRAPADATPADATPADAAPAKLLAAHTRAVVFAAVERVLTLADHALGPAPLTTDELYARRIADLHLYLRQHHAERDLARLGALVASS